MFPVFVINGFLDAGKTTFIIDTVKNDGFADKGNTLLIVFEQGEVEYDEKELAKYNVHVATFESPEEFTPDVAYELTESFHPLRIVVEANSMWDQSKIVFPKTFQVAQIVSFIDFTTFEIYFNNMRQKFVDNLRFADTIVINRCDEPEKLAKYQTALKMINNNAQWVAMASDGSVQNAFEEPLPFDVDADVIQVKDEDFAVWYIDTFDHHERYEGKKVEFNGIVLKSIKLPPGTCIIGRYAMTCCSNDIQLYGHLSKLDKKAKIKNKSWVHVVCEMHYEYSKEYDEDEMVLNPISIEKIPEIKDSVLNLTQ